MPTHRAAAATAAATAVAVAATAAMSSKKDRWPADITVATLLQLEPQIKQIKAPAASGGDKKKRAGGSRGVRLNYDTAYAADPSRSIRSLQYEYRIKS